MLQILLQVKISFHIGLMQDELLSRSMTFYNYFADYLNSVIMPGFDAVQLPEFPLPKTLPPLFAFLPDWFLSDLAEFLIFILKYGQKKLFKNLLVCYKTDAYFT